MTTSESGLELEEIFALTPMQQGMLFHSAFDPKSSAYLVQVSCALEGALDTAAFERAFQQVFERHAALRAAFPWERDRGRLQVIFRHIQLPLRLEDLRGLPAQRQEEAVRALLLRDRCAGFDLTKPPLMRLALARLAADRHRFVWSYHHALLDGWSAARVLDEVGRCYGALIQGKAPELQAPVPYAHYARWLRDQPLSAARERLSAQPAALELPLGVAVRLHDAACEPEYQERLEALEPEATAQLRALAERARVTPGSLVLAAWLIVLSRTSGLREIGAGVTVSGRPSGLPRAEELVGLFINTLPLRLEVREQETLAAFARRVQSALLELAECAHVPLAELQRAQSRPGPPFDHLFVFENYPLSGAEVDVPGLRVADVHSFEPTDYPLTLVVLPGAELKLQAMFDAHRLDGPRVESLLRGMRRLLAAFANADDRPLWTLHSLSDPERAALLARGRGAPHAHEPKLAHAWFERQASRTPNATAVSFGDETLDYATLERQANQLAHHLRRLGVGPDVRVGLLVERSLSLPVAVLGVLKAGGAYVPLDSGYPEARLRFMAEDARLALILTSASLRGHVPHGRARVVELEGIAQALAAESGEPPQVRVDPRHLLYVIYTSGSTGRPKGVALPHAALSNLIGWHLRTLGPSRGFLQFASLSFDASAHELFAAWAGGGCAYLIPEALRQDLDALLVDVASRPIERAILPVVVLQRWAAEHGANLPLFRNLREIITTGEQLQITAAIRELFARAPQLRLINHYGPSETHVVTDHALGGDPARWPGLPPLGAAIDNTDCFVLDDQGRPVPDGAVGELYLGGSNLARGYLERPGSTAAKFVPHPFSAEPGARLYATGDRARWLPDGTLAFAGRRDGMIKLRGVRVELGEIEAALCRSPDVEACAALAHGELEERRIVAYVIARRGRTPVAAGLRAHLERSLPQAMVPSAFVLVPELPLTANGKVDKSRLDPGALAAASSSRAYVAPSDPIEVLLADVWADVLELPRVGARDDFFELGGHSLSALRVLSRIRAALGITPPLRLLFERPVLSELAAELRKQLALEPVRPPSPECIPHAEGELVPLSFAQERLYFLEQLTPGTSLYNLPGRIDLDGPLDRTALETALRRLVARHASLRTRFLRIDGTPFQQIESNVELDLPCVDLRSSASAEASAGRVCQQLSAAPFDLEAGLLLRARLLVLREDRHVLSLTLHHLVADGTSLPILVRELAAMYAGARGEATTALPELTVQYADLAAHERRYPDASMDAGVDHFVRQLSGVPALQLPADHARSPARARRAGEVHARIAPEQRLALQQVARRAGATPNMLLLGVFAELLSRLAGQDRVTIGVPVALRDRPEAEGLVGLFVNLLPLQLDSSVRRTGRELIAHAKQVSLAAFAHRRAPFERVVERLQPDRDQAQTPVVQVLFDFHAWREDPVRGAGLCFTPAPVANEHTRFDVTLTATDAPAGIELVLEYDRDVFEPARMFALLRGYERLVSELVRAPGAIVADLELVDSAERQRLLAWSGRRQLPEPDCTVLELFDRQVRRVPEAPALQGQTTVSYRELAGRVNQLAHALRTRGVGVECVVGHCLLPSIESVIALLAVLRAGAAYLPLDPTHPPLRVGAVLRDAGAAWVLAESRTAPALRDSRAPQLVLDEPRVQRELALYPTAAPDDPPSLANLAYVLYTSGSTGRPKGCLIDHRALASYLGWASEHYFTSDAAGDFGLFSALTFDLTVTSLFLPLIRGRSLRVVASTSDAETALTGALHEVDSIKLTPSHLELLDRGALPAEHLRLAIVGGEALAPKHVAALRKLAPRARIHNEYGPTEATVGCVAGEVEAGAGPVRIGMPARHARVYVLDRRGQLQVPGAVGELYVGGPALARGYLGRPGLTAERFVPDPFSERAGQRLYRTGDLAAFDEHGRLACFGRTDAQLKLHGHRIEPQEIELALMAHPEVRRAVVDVRAVDREGAGADVRLCAYVESCSELAGAALRDFLAARLPAAWLPRFFVRIDRWPLTAHGKVDRRALPAPQPEHVDDSDWIAPRNAVEAALAEIFQEVLRLDRVSIRDNYFALGGDSILSLQLVARAARRGLTLTVQELFSHQTVEALARVARPIAVASPRATQRSGPLPPTPMQHWFFEQRLAEPHHFNQALVIVLADGSHPDWLEIALQHVVDRHAALRLRVEAFGPAPALTVAPRAPRIELERLELASEAEVARACSELQAGLDPAAGRVLRACFLRSRTGAPDRLLLVAHHLVIDGVSWRILLEDLSEAYASLTAGRSPELPIPACSILDFAEAARAAAIAPELRSQLEHWEHGCAPAPLPAGFDPEPGCVAEQRSHSLQVTPPLSAALVQELPAVLRCRLDDVLVAALLIAWCDGTGLTRLRFDREGHGRDGWAAALDLSRSIGWFTALYPVRLELPDAVTAAAVLRSVQSSLRAIPGHGLGYGLLRYLHPDPALRARMAAHEPSPVSFNYHGHVDAAGFGALFLAIDEAPGPDRSPSARRSHALELSAVVRDGRLEVTFTHRDTRAQAAFVERLSESYLRALERLGRLRDEPRAWTEVLAGGLDVSDRELAELEAELLT